MTTLNILDQRAEEKAPIFLATIPPKTFPVPHPRKAINANSTTISLFYQRMGIIAPVIRLLGECF
jgi:hypothetical protein